MATREQVLAQHKANLPNKISFFGDYRALSNFHKESFIWKDITWPSSENAYQAYKTYEVDWPRFAKMSPSESKKEGRLAVLIWPNWDKMKYGVMKDILTSKFAQCPIARCVLLSTGNAHLEECNWWGDKYYGTYDGVGFNALGKILMEIRKFILHEDTKQ